MVVILDKWMKLVMSMSVRNLAVESFVARKPRNRVGVASGRDSKSRTRGAERSAVCCRLYALGCML